LGHGGYRLHFFTGPMRAARNGPISNDVLADWGARIRGWLGIHCWSGRVWVQKSDPCQIMCCTRDCQQVFFLLSKETPKPHRTFGQMRHHKWLP